MAKRRASWRGGPRDQVVGLAVVGSCPWTLDRDPVRRYWLCKCGYRNERTKQRCPNLDCRAKRPRAHRPQHEKALDNSYEVFRDFNGRVHGPAFGPEWQPQNCGVCGKPPSEHRRHDRDHGHRKGENSYGRMRGLACPGDSGCNMLMKGLTAVRARQIADYMERAEIENADVTDSTVCGGKGFEGGVDTAR